MSNRGKFWATLRARHDRKVEAGRMSREQADDQYNRQRRAGEQRAADVATVLERTPDARDPAAERRRDEEIWAAARDEVRRTQPPAEEPAQDLTGDDRS